MKNYVYILIIIISGILCFRLIDILGMPYWVVFASIPILFYVAIYATSIYNFRDSLDFQKIPVNGYEERLAKLEKNGKRLYSMGFVKFDEFYLPIANDVVTYVYYHKDFPVLLCDYHFGQLNCVDLISKFENGFTLSTSNTKHAGLVPRDKENMLQIFPNDNIENLLKKHNNSAYFLEQRSFTHQPLNKKTFRDWFMSDYRNTGKSLKNPLSPIKLLYWRQTSQHSKYIKTVQEQFLAKTQQLP